MGHISIGTFSNESDRANEKKHYIKDIWELPVMEYSVNCKEIHVSFASGRYLKRNGFFSD